MLECEVTVIIVAVYLLHAEKWLRKETERGRRTPWQKQHTSATAEQHCVLIINLHLSH